MVKLICRLIGHKYKKILLSLEGDWLLKCQRCSHEYWIVSNMTDEQKQKQWKKQGWN